MGYLYGFHIRNRSDGFRQIPHIWVLGPLGQLRVGSKYWRLIGDLDCVFLVWVMQVPD